MCLTLPRDADHRDGHREAGADLAGPRGVPAAAAALVDRRADEPVHLDVDRRDAGRRAAGVPPGAARQRPHRGARRPGRAGRRCAASAARPASTSARCTSAPAGTRTARSIPGRSARCSPRSSPGVDRTTPSLPYASSLCGACFDACPVTIDIPSDAGPPALPGGRAKREHRTPTPERRDGRAAAWIMARPDAGPRRSAPRAWAGCWRRRAGSPRCRRRCPAGPPAGTCPSRRRRPSATGGARRTTPGPARRAESAR